MIDTEPGCFIKKKDIKIFGEKHTLQYWCMRCITANGCKGSGD